MKRVLAVSLWCLIIVACANQQVVFTATPLPTFAEPELTTEHISGWIAYSVLVSREPFVTQIFLKNLETDETRQLTNSGNNSWARWSPDGTQIMYVSWTKENLFDIYIMDKGGGNQRPIISTPANELVPDWSPDGRKIAYVVSDEDSISNIYVFDLQTMKTMQITSDTLGGFAPKWSPNGSELSFVSNSSENKRDGRSQVFIMNADGSDVRQMTPYDLDHFEDSPVWCPDSSCIIFMRFIGPPKLMFLDLASGEVTQFIPNVFDDEIMETGLARSSSRGYITFIAGETYYAMDVNTKRIYSLGVKNAYDLALYP